MSDGRSAFRVGAGFVGPGRPDPLGATVFDGGVNFSVYSRSATGVDLVLFDAPEAPPVEVIPLDPEANRTFHYWHIFVPGIGEGQAYAFHVDGPWRPEAGLRFDRRRYLLDPYGKGVILGVGSERPTVPGDAGEPGTAHKSVVVDRRRPFDWEGDRPLNRPFSETVIYEMHVGGFTRHPSSGVAQPGTWAGLVEKIPYLRDLGVTAVELLPVFQFDDRPGADGRSDYWGYAPLSFFAPHTGYASRRDPLASLDEFREMVKQLHRAGIEVILDVVVNHTGEGNDRGPTLWLRGFEDRDYYLLDERGDYRNFSGTGNTLNANHSVVRRLIQDSLTWWVEAMHVDGFRFDLASVLSRDEAGRPMENPPVLWAIESNPVLAGTKLIAEAWDAGGLYQVGSFIGDRWQEWNGRFRDDVRAFVKSDRGMVPQLASRLLGSPDLFGHEAREPEQSVNFVTCHDGFTVNDLVSYDHKHNLANGEENRDGTDNNLSSNHGVEGPTDDPAIEALRNRQVKNLLAVTVLAMGTPMLLMGDEIRRTQRGNNNAYCQDNEVSWMDWRLLERHGDVHRFVRGMIELRRRLPFFRAGRDWSLAELLAHADIRLHGVRLDRPDLSDKSRSLALTVRSLDGPTAKGGGRLHAMLNAFWEPLEFELPPLGEGDEPWRRKVDTALPSPDDLADGPGPHVEEGTYRVEAPSVVVLLSAARPVEPRATTASSPGTTEPERRR